MLSLRAGSVCAMRSILKRPLDLSSRSLLNKIDNERQVTVSNSFIIRSTIISLSVLLQNIDKPLYAFLQT